MLIAKKRISRAYPIACNPPFIVVTILHIAPPLKFCGEVVISDHISVILSFQVPNAFSKFATIQLSLKFVSPPFLYATAAAKGGGYTDDYSIKSRISFANAIITPPKNVKKPFALCDASCDLSDKPI